MDSCPKLSYLIHVAAVLCFLISWNCVQPARQYPENEIEFDLILLHNNDMHSRFDETNAVSAKCEKNDRIEGKCYGGFARVSEIVNRYRKTAEKSRPGVLYLNAGDTYFGTPWYNVFKHEIVTQFMNLLKPDAAVCVYKMIFHCIQG